MIKTVKGRSLLIFKGWCFVILIRSVYGDRYDNREASGIGVFREDKNDSLSFVCCSDSILGTFIKKFPQGVEILINKYLGVHGEKGLLDGSIYL